MAVAVGPACSIGFLAQEARAAFAPPWGKLDRGVATELYWKPGMTLVSRGEKTAMAALLACSANNSDLEQLLVVVITVLSAWFPAVQ